MRCESALWIGYDGTAARGTRLIDGGYVASDLSESWSIVGLIYVTGKCCQEFQVLDLI